MAPIPSNIARTLSRIAITVGALWDLYARLAVLVTEDGREVAQVAETAQGVLDELSPMRAVLAELAETLPGPFEGLIENEVIELDPLELSRAQVECVLADRLDPAIEALRALLPTDETEGPVVEEVRTALLCVMTDRLVPSIAGLTSALAVFEDTPK